MGGWRKCRLPLVGPGSRPWYWYLVWVGRGFSFLHLSSYDWWLDGRRLMPWDGERWLTLMVHTLYDTAFTNMGYGFAYTMLRYEHLTYDL